jgi:hypothetical protein
MTVLAPVLRVMAEGPSGPQRGVAADRLSALARHSTSALGPIAVSAAHFVAALIFLHTLPRVAFGLFSFVLVLVPFSMSMCGAMFAAPLARSARTGVVSEADTFTYLKTNAAFAVLAGLAIAGLMAASGANAVLAVLFGFYGCAMVLRWFARNYAYVTRKLYRALASDLAYSLLLVTGLGALVATHFVTAANGAAMLLLSGVAAVAPFGANFLRKQVVALFAGRITGYRDIWRDLSRWSLLGVVMSEMCANAHAYLVTFISGPHAFAVLAVGSLLMRPVSLILSALPDVERPLMAQELANHGPLGALRIVKEFRTAAGAIWLVTIVLSAALLTWFPHLLIKKDYALTDVVWVLVLSSGIMALRSLRTPESVLLQAAGEFRKLAVAGAWAAGTTVVATIVLLLTIGPVAALGGILLGDLVLTGRVFALARAWKLQQ